MFFLSYVFLHYYSWTEKEASILVSTLNYKMNKYAVLLEGRGMTTSCKPHEKTSWESLISQTSCHVNNNNKLKCFSHLTTSEVSQN